MMQERRCKGSEHCWLTSVGHIVHITQYCFLCYLYFQVQENVFEMPYRSNYLNKTTNKHILDAYLEFMTKTSVLLGANETHARTQMIDVIDFETHLANITTPSESYQTKSLQELQKLSPFIKWHDYFNGAFRMVSKKIGAKEMVVVKSEALLMKLNTLVNKYSTTIKGNK